MEYTYVTAIHDLANGDLVGYRFGPTFTTSTGAMEWFWNTEAVPMSSWGQTFEQFWEYGDDVKYCTIQRVHHHNA